MEKLDEFFVQGGAAFFGAFFAYLFGRLAGFFEAIARRIGRDHDALVKLERITNGYSCHVNPNRVALESFRELSKHAGDLKPARVMNRLYTFDSFPDAALDLTDLNLINRYLLLNLRISLWNKAAEAINGMYEKAANGLPAQFPKEDAPRLLGIYYGECEPVFKALPEMESALKEIEHMTLDCWAQVRILLAKPSWTIRISGWLSGNRSPKNIDELIDAERKKIYSELKETGQGAPAALLEKSSMRRNFPMS